MAAAIDASRRGLLGLLVFAIGLLQASCETVDGSRGGARLDESLARERLEVGTRLFLDLIEEKSRLLDVEFALDVASARACRGVTRPHYGVLTGGRASLDRGWLREVADEKRVVGENLTILHLAPGSPFAEAGLRVGDEILAVDGEVVRSHGALHAHRMRTRGDGPTRVRFRREGLEQSVEVPVVAACPVVIEVYGSESLVAFSRPGRVYVPRGLLSFAEDPDTLAVAAGHAFAHALWDRGGGDRLVREREADLLGTEAVARAGFDVRATVAYWESVARAHPRLVLSPDPSKSQLEELVAGLRLGLPQLHDGLAMRMKGIRRAVEGASQLYGQRR